MICLVEREEQKQRLVRLCERTPFGCKILSVIAAYGYDRSFACFWLDEKADAVFCQADDVMILSGTVLDAVQTREFLRAVGCGRIMCAVRNAEALALPQAQTGDVLKRQIEEGEAKPFDRYSVNIREVYSLLEEAGMVDEFEPFYLDLSHKLRHGASLALTHTEDGEPVGCAVVSAIGGTSAILSAVAVRPSYRRRGIGSALVRQAEQYFPGKTVYVFREKDEHTAFYRSLGYVKTDTWVLSLPVY